MFWCGWENTNHTITHQSPDQRYYTEAKGHRSSHSSWYFTLLVHSNKYLHTAANLQRYSKYIITFHQSQPKRLYIYSLWLNTSSHAIFFFLWTEVKHSLQINLTPLFDHASRNKSEHHKEQSTVDMIRICTRTVIYTHLPWHTQGKWNCFLVYI